MITDQLTDEQIEVLAAPTHITTSDPCATEVIRRNTWVMLLDRRYVATVYDLTIRNRWLTEGRADRAIASYAYRHPQKRA